MEFKFKSVVLAGAMIFVAAPAFAQIPPEMNPLGLDLDPFHIFTPAPAPAAEPMKPMMHHKMMHKKMMHKKMMKKKMMMKKPMDEKKM